MKNNMLESLTSLQNAVLDIITKELKGVSVEKNVLEMQELIELLSVCHCARVGNRADAQYLADALHTHLTQILDQHFAAEHL
jgi:hypothetical protein